MEKKTVTVTQEFLDEWTLREASLQRQRNFWKEMYGFTVGGYLALKALFYLLRHY